MRPHLVPFHYQQKFDEKIGTPGAGVVTCADLGETSRWFDTLAVVELPPGASDGPRVYGGEGATAETWYILSAGHGEFTLPDGSVEKVRKFDGIYFGAGAGGTLRAGSQGLTWLIVSTDGGKPTPFTKVNQRGAGSKVASLAGAAAPVVFHRAVISPRQWPANKLGATAKPWWFFTVDDYSKWYHSACVSCIPPGGASTFHTHMERYEGPYETFYIVLDGTALIRNEYEDRLFEGGPSGVYVPADASHQIINAGEGLLWYLTLSSRGGAELTIDVYNTPSGAERPGYQEEYNRIIRERSANNLPVP